MSMTDDALRSFIERQEARALRPETAAEQALAMRYYRCQPFGNEQEGYSSVISSDVWDVVEGLTPLILKPFVSSDDVVRFQPQGPEDEEAAAQETDYLNYIVTQKNDVFEQLVTWVKLGLLQKNGVVKYWWDEARKVRIETYRGISDDIFTLLQQDPDITVLEHTELPPDADGMPMHDVKIRAVQKDGCAKFEAIPPEELLISPDTRSPNPKLAPFIQHRVKRTISDLRAAGYDVPDDINDASGGDASSEPQALARQRNDQTFQMDGMGDPSAREVWYRESYAYVDVDGDGIAEARRVCMVGSTILDSEEVTEWPFAGWTPYLQLFQFDGRCPADETIEIQEVKSTLWRQSLQNIYTINNNRTYVSDKVNLDDMLDNQISGVVRVTGDNVGAHAMSMPITPIGGVVQPMIEYLDSAKENRTGFTRYNQGTDSNSLNKTATGVRLITEAGNERVGLMSRAFAEQGLKPLMLGMHALCRAHATKAETMRLRGKWVDIDPRSWVNRTDMSISVGLGTADKTMQLQGHQMLMAEQKALAQVPGLVVPENFYASAAKLSEILGEKDPAKFFSDPEKVEKPEIPPEVQQALQQASQEIQQLQQALQEAQSGMEAKKIDAEVKLQIEAMRLQSEDSKQQMAMAIEEMRDDQKRDAEELKTWLALTLQQMQPQQVLTAAVTEDLGEEQMGESDGQD